MSFGVGGYVAFAVDKQHYQCYVIMSTVPPPPPHPLPHPFQVKLVCTAAVPPQELFRARPQHSREEQTSRVLLDDLEIAEVCAYTKSVQ